MIKKYYKLILWTVLIAYLCFAPADEFKKVHISIPHLDKVVHFIMFYILGVFIHAANTENMKLRMYFVFFGVLYGMLIEIAQYYLIVTRSGDVIDFVFDIIGLFIGLYSYYFFPKFAKRLL